MADFRWVATDSASCGALRTSALMGGRDEDGSSLYVGRACYAGNWIPAKVNLDNGIAHVCHDGIEIAVDQFELYCGSQLQWVRAQNGEIPAGAIQAGEVCGEPAYVGRIRHGSCAQTVTVGKVLESKGTCCVPYDGKEEASTDYEVLVLTQ